MDQSQSISNKDIIELDYLSLTSYLNEPQVNVVIENNGFWINIFNFLTPFCKENENKYPFIIYNNYETLPKFNKTSAKLKNNNIIEIIEWKIINFII